MSQFSLCSFDFGAGWADAELCNTRAVRRRVSPLPVPTGPEGAFLGPAHREREWFCPPMRHPGWGAAGALQASSQTLGEIPAGTCPEARAGGPQAHCPMLPIAGRDIGKGLARQSGDTRGGLAGTSVSAGKGKQQAELVVTSCRRFLCLYPRRPQRFPFTPQHASLSSARLL